MSSQAALLQRVEQRLGPGLGAAFCSVPMGDEATAKFQRASVCRRESQKMLSGILRQVSRKRVYRTYFPKDSEKTRCCSWEKFLRSENLFKQRRKKRCFHWESQPADKNIPNSQSKTCTQTFLNDNQCWRKRKKRKSKLKSDSWRRDFIYPENLQETVKIRILHLKNNSVRLDPILVRFNPTPVCLPLRSGSVGEL